MTKRILTKAFNELDIVKKDRDLEIPGILGWVLNGVNTVDVPNREGYVYVRLRSNTSELIQAYNDMVSPVFGLPVLVIRDEVDKTRYKIKGKDLGIYQDWGNAPYLPRHGNTHSFFGGAQGGGDVVFVHPQQFMPLLAHPSGSAGSSSLVIEPYTFYDGSNWKYVGGTGTVNLTTYNPTGSNARMVLVYIDADGNPNYEAGSSYFSTSITGAAQVIPYIPQPPTGTAIPVAAVRLVSGTSIINWANLYETRPFFNLSGTASGGGGGGGAPTTAQYVTMALDGTLSAERVLTAGADITITDGGANGNVTVGVTTNTFASGSHTHPAGTSAVIVYDDSTFKATGTAISFDKDLEVSATGTVAFVNIPAGTFASGTHTHPSSVSPIVIYEDSAYKSTGTAISFNQYLDVVATGSSAFVDVNIPDGIFASGSHTHPAGASAIQIYEDSVYKATGTLISFNNNLDVIVTGTSVFVNSTATGGGGGYPVIYDDSTYKVTGSAISFDKDLSVVVTGSTAYVDIPAGTFASGSHTHPAGATAIQIYDDNVFSATGTLISFNNGLFVDVTGTSAYISTSGTGDMLKSVYDTDNDGIVDNAERLVTNQVEVYDNSEDGAINVRAISNNKGTKLLIQPKGTPSSGDSAIHLYYDRTSEGGTYERGLFFGPTHGANQYLFLTADATAAGQMLPIIFGAESGTNVTEAFRILGNGDFYFPRYFEISEINTPGSPSANKLRIYSKDDGGTTKLYYKRSTGTEVELGATSADEKAKVSANDTTAGYLNGKLVAGSGITLTENNDGSNETLTITGGHFELLQDEDGNPIWDENLEYLYTEVNDA